MKEKRIIDYAFVANGERLKPFLFWMIVAAAALVATAFVIGCDPGAVHMLIRRVRYYFN